MRPRLLCRERLSRILALLERHNDGISVRDFSRTFGIRHWELEQAENLGWISISVRKPRVGRPSLHAVKVSVCQSAKHPPFRHEIPKKITFRHRMFAIHSVTPVAARSWCGIAMPTKTLAYMLTYPRCRNPRAAAAAACRLMKRTDVRLMRRWLFCEINHEVTGDMPTTVEGLIAQLEPLGVLRFRSRQVVANGFE